MINRRRLLQTGASLAGAALLPQITGAAPTRELTAQITPQRPMQPSPRAPRQPNVLFILTDDQGANDVGCYGAQDIETPNMDALARRGVRFTQFYATSPICSPSRASILTGKCPQKAGLTGNAGAHYGEHGMPASQVTIAEIFKAAGYATGHVGKWHLGFVPAEMPNAQGFDFSFGFMGGCIDNYSHYYYWGGANSHDLWRNGTEEWREGQFFGDLTVHECNAFIENHHDQPFFLYWAINLPHYPLQGKAKWREHYAKLPSPRDKYAASVSTADELIGQVLSKLDELKLRDNTIVVFMSDQGHSMEDRAFSGGGSAGPYRGAKFSLFEGGLRMPAMISWPGHLPQNAVRDQLMMGYDWLPTLANLCMVPLPTSLAPQLDGRDVTDILRSETAPSPHQVTHWMVGEQWAVREGDWKLIGNPLDPARKEPMDKADAFFLVNLRDDEGEQRNQAAAQSAPVERLRQLHREWVTQLATGPQT